MKRNMWNVLVNAPARKRAYARKEHKMAKQHVFDRVKLWFGENEVPLHNQISRLRFHLEFSVKHDGDAVSTDHHATFDLQMPRIRLLEFVKNSVAILLQNKILRPMTNVKAKEWLKTHDPIKIEDLSPGRKTTVIKMTDAEVKEKAQNDPEYRAKMIADLMAMK